MRYEKLNKIFLMLTIHIDLSIVSLRTFKKNQRKMTITSSPIGFFDVPKRVVLADIPYCPENEELSKHFMEKLL